MANAVSVELPLRPFPHHDSAVSEHLLLGPPLPCVFFYPALFPTLPRSPASVSNPRFSSLYPPSFRYCPHFSAARNHCLCFRVGRPSEFPHLLRFSASALHLPLRRAARWCSNILPTSLRLFLRLCPFAASHKLAILARQVRSSLPRP